MYAKWGTFNEVDSHGLFMPIFVLVLSAAMIATDRPSFSATLLLLETLSIFVWYSLKDGQIYSALASKILLVLALVILFCTIYIEKTLPNLRKSGWFNFTFLMAFFIFLGLFLDDFTFQAGMPSELSSTAGEGAVVLVAGFTISVILLSSIFILKIKQDTE
jgi:hypothetical protein